MKNSLLLLLLCKIVSILLAAASADPEGCNKGSTCVPESHCPDIAEARITMRSVQSQAVRAALEALLQERRCPAASFKFCCPEDQIVRREDDINHMPVSKMCGRISPGLFGKRVTPLEQGDGEPHGAWPWMASVGFRKTEPGGGRGKWSHACGATVVTKRHLVTAAHCNVRKRLWARLGTSDLEDENTGEEHVIADFVQHEKHQDPLYYYDVAVAVLDAPVIFGDYLRPICLPNSATGADENEGKLVTLTGWGLRAVNDPPEDGGGKLQKTLLGVYSFSHCNSSYAIRGSSSLVDTIRTKLPSLFTDTIICAGYDGGNTGSCSGDSGGPISHFNTANSTRRHFQVGIVSGGLGRCGDRNFPDVYVRVGSREILAFLRRVAGQELGGGLDGGWSPWGSFSPCSSTCGAGTRVRERRCDSPKPEGGGERCRGSDRHAVFCFPRRCPQSRTTGNEDVPTTTTTTTTTLRPVLDGEGARNDSTVCPTEAGGRCVFPYRDEDGRLTYLCQRKLFGLGTHPDRIFSHVCPTKVDRRTLKPSDWKPCCSSCSPSQCPLAGTYHSNEELFRGLRRLAETHPDHVKTFQVGESVKGSPLLGIRLSRDLSFLFREGNRRHAPLEMRPRVLLSANLHGNAAVGRELLAYLPRYILDSDAAGLDQRSADVLDTLDLYIIPSLNPDGFSRARQGRCEARSYNAGYLNEGRANLERDFPGYLDWLRYTAQPGYGLEDLLNNRQKETKAIVSFALDNPFVMSASFGDGAVLVKYPLNTLEKRSSESSDDQELQMLATAYGASNPDMKNTSASCRKWGHFKDGVSRGADWLPSSGTMQEFMYLFSGSLDVKVYTSCCGNSINEQENLVGFWEKNHDGIFSFLELSQQGVRGRVAGGNYVPVAGAKVRIRRKGEEDWRDTVSTTDGEGMFWRILVPGEYVLQAYWEADLDQGSKQYVQTDNSTEVAVAVPELGKGILPVEVVLYLNYNYLKVPFS